MNVHHSNTIIQQPFERSYATAVGFLTIQQQDLNKNLLSNPVGFAITKLIGNYFQIIEVVEMINLPLERERVINFILSWREKKVVFDHCYIDKDNYQLFNFDRRWESLIKLREFAIRYPRLKATIRPEDLIYRQKEALSQPFREKTLVAAKNLNNPADLSSLDQVGSSPALDALAGAVTEITKIQRNLLYQVSKEQQRIKAANGRSIY